jgi:hypothetical protein
MASDEAKFCQIRRHRPDSIDRPDPPTPENVAQPGQMPPAIQVSVGVEDGARAFRECRESVQLKMALDDDVIGAGPAERVPDVPQRRRPDFAVLVFVSSTRRTHGARRGSELSGLRMPSQVITALSSARRAFVLCDAKKLAAK